ANPPARVLRLRVRSGRASGLRLDRSAQDDPGATNAVRASATGPRSRLPSPTSLATSDGSAFSGARRRREAGGTGRQSEDGAVVWRPRRRWLPLRGAGVGGEGVPEVVVAADDAAGDRVEELEQRPELGGRVAAERVRGARDRRPALLPDAAARER